MSEPAAPKVYKTRRAAEADKAAKAGSTQRMNFRDGYILLTKYRQEIGSGLAQREPASCAGGGAMDRNSVLTAVAKLGGQSMKDRADTIRAGIKSTA